MKCEKPPKIQRRIHALYLIKRHLVATRKALAEMFGVRRKTIGEWLTIYEQQGFSKLLTLHPHSNRHRAVPGPVLDQLKAQLEKPQGFKGDTSICRWLKERFALEIPDKTGHKTVRYSLQAKPKVPRKSNSKKDPQAQEDFMQEGFAQDLQTVSARASPEQPIRVFAQDETRWGLMPLMTRVITLKGVKPIGQDQHVLDNYYLYGAVEPTTGDDFSLEFPHLDPDCFQVFLNEFSQTFASSFNILLFDRGQFHRAKTLCIPENIGLSFQPAHSPELHPIERLWQYLKEHLAAELFETLDQLKHRIAQILKQLSRERVKSLTGFTFFLNAVNVTFQ